MNQEKSTRYLCTKEHGTITDGIGGMYHYSDEVIYEKHLEENNEIEEIQSDTKHTKQD